MHFLILLLIAGVCQAHYRGEYDSRNLIEREELDLSGVYFNTISAGTNRCIPKSTKLKYFKDYRELVECPVCEGTYTPSQQKCTIMKGGKWYKRCRFGTYENEICGNRRDCYRGPKEECSEKKSIDDIGAKCARGLICHDVFHECTGLDYAVDSNRLWLLNKVWRYPLRSQHGDQGSLKDY